MKPKLSPLEAKLVAEEAQETQPDVNYYAPGIRWASPIKELVAAGVDNRAINALMHRGADSDGDGITDGDVDAQRRKLAKQLLAEKGVK